MTIADNRGDGVHITDATNTIVRNNYVGTNAAGTSALGNSYGVIVDGSSSGVTVRSNVLSGNVSFVGNIDLKTGSVVPGLPGTAPTPFGS